MRVLHLNPTADFGGVEVMILSFLDRSRKRGDSTAVAMSPGKWTPKFQDRADYWFDLPQVGRDIKRLPKLVAEIRRIIRSFQPDVIHAHNPTMMLAALMALGLRAPGLIGTLHGNEEGDYRREAFIGHAFKLRGKVTVCSPCIGAELSRFGLNEHTVITNGISPAPAAISRAECAQKFDVDPDSPIIVGVGRLVTMKRWQLAIAAMPKVPEASLVIFGEGDQRAILEQQIAELGVSDRVKLPGAVSNVRSYTAAADAAIVTSRGEGFSLAVLEHLDVGLPVVASDVPGITDVVNDDSAWIIDAENPDSIAAALKEIMAGGPNVEERIAAGRDIAHNSTEEAMIDKYFALYEQVRARK
ncbi:glycosyltransferase [Corynebacterium sp. TAE3-ERU12]|uniref:glycosyltransferase n=1 Tax=Corynebacterium sp. TAE3-ERU12 TaxID=2849491 RepID=UPI002101F9F2|nr:glycosyltransferase [Corynebacterium sp. TAE3-ERU12]